jgi:hypothetical protein
MIIKENPIFENIFRITNAESAGQGSNFDFAVYSNSQLYDSTSYSTRNLTTAGSMTTMSRTSWQSDQADKAKRDSVNSHDSGYQVNVRENLVYILKC